MENNRGKQMRNGSGRDGCIQKIFGNIPIRQKTNEGVRQHMRVKEPLTLLSERIRRESQEKDDQRKHGKKALTNQ